MNIKKALVNILNILLNIFCGWFSFMWLAYSLLAITDRRDADAELTVPIGYAMLITGFVVTLCFRLFQLFRKNKIIYLLCNILPWFITFILLILIDINFRMGYLI